MLSRGERGAALLPAIAALALVGLLLPSLWLWSRVESRDASAALARSRAEWLAAGVEVEALRWLVARDVAEVRDTVLAALTGPRGVAGEAVVRVQGAELVRLVVTATAPGDGAAPARVRRCRWLVAGPPDSAGRRALAGVPGLPGASCE